MRITRVYTGDDGESHFEDIDIAFPEAMGLGMRTQHFPADSISMRQASVDSEMDFHTAPRRQFVITVADAPRWSAATARSANSAPVTCCWPTI